MYTNQPCSLSVAGVHQPTVFSLCNRCPTYTNIPAECTRTPASGSTCCETITCPLSTKLVPSTTNVLSIGSGNHILQPDPLSPSHMISVVPSLPPSGVTLGPNDPVQGYQAPTISEYEWSKSLSLQIPRTRLFTVGSRAFSVFGPSTWSELSLLLGRNPLWTLSDLI